MLDPGEFETFDGRVGALTPTEADRPYLRRALDARAMPLFSGTRDMDVYRARLEDRWALLETLGGLRPGELTAAPWGGRPRPVQDGDTLTCRCAKGADCHRRWASPALTRSGWIVYLDGERL